VHPLKTPTNDPRRRRGDNDHRTSGQTSVRGEINVPDEDLVTTIMRASEMIAASFRPGRGIAAPAPQFATPEDYDESVLPNDFSELASVLAHIRSLMAHDPKLARQASYAREAFGDGETLKVLFHGLFPGQKSTPYHNPDGTPILTLREVEVLRQAACDLTREEIAARLHITPRTVGTHLTNIYAKLHVQRPMQAVARAISMGYLDIDAFRMVALAGNNSPREYRLFDTLTSEAQAVDHAPLDTAIRPLAEFGLLLLLLAGKMAHLAVVEAQARPLPRAVVCEVDSVGRLVRTFGSDRLFGRTGLVVAPPRAARQGFHPGHLFVTSQQIAVSGLNLSALHEFTPEGQFVRTFCGGREIGTRLASSPPGVFHPDGRLLVACGSSTDALLAFRRGGATVRRFANIICGQVSVGPFGAIYAAHVSTVGGCIRVYDAGGRLLRTFGSTPAGAGYSGLAVDSRGHVWVNYDENDAFALREFGSDGTLRRTLPLPGLGRGCLAVDERDHLYVPCPRGGDIKILTPDGNVVRRIGLRGRLTPTSVAVGTAGQLYIVGEV
jgi:DNA-binding CsgD family transcriptional regulator